MPTEIYTKTTDDEGNESYVPVEDVTTVIDDGIVHNHPAYKKVVAESVKRRQQLAELRQKLEAEPSDNEEVAAVAPTPAPAFDPSAFADQVLAAFDGKLNARQERQAKLKGLLETHKLALSALPILEQSQDPEAVAQLLGQHKFTFEGTEAGATEDKDATPALMQRVYERMSLK